MKTRLLLFRRFLSLKLKLTFKSTTGIQALIWSRVRLLHEITDCAMLSVDLCETIPFWSLNNDPTYSSSIVFILRNTIRFLPRVPYSRLRRDPLVLLYCLKFSVHTYYWTIVQEILLFMIFFHWMPNLWILANFTITDFFNISIPSVLENFLPLWETLHHS